MSGGYDAVEVGDTATTAGRTITEADVANFAGVSGDFNHLHLDAETMAATEYGERIVHGALVFSVATGLLWQHRDDDIREHVVAFYGVDRLRFVRPCFIGDTLHVVREVLEKERREHPVATGIVRYEITVLNQRDETVLAAEFLSLLQ
ncbi:monoamine oxidase regulatory protein [Salinarchaeum sp. Harcht-Bsk1]|uniref:MaoC/PaaZ C-terminal domain-containing protein n=1 Tax=Salinarchaeum sp. Harcht-Bsk1 TaxID=1333523 RepID=UPI0003422D14|nr:MaoC/PaaZ C-terminal domain-containing protein [Salinarchaeum sp. Harcht-Bsk1]AGN00165.1 monoamine oxidase regulatory protein [Salinarchaeum sp. Harcht-Bsk1]